MTTREKVRYAKRAISKASSKALQFTKTMLYGSRALKVENRDGSSEMLQSSTFTIENDKDAFKRLVRRIADRWKS